MGANKECTILDWSGTYVDTIADVCGKEGSINIQVIWSGHHPLLSIPVTR